MAARNASVLCAALALCAALLAACCGCSAAEPGMTIDMTAFRDQGSRERGGPAGAGYPAGFAQRKLTVFGLHKSGTMFASRFFQGLANAHGIKPYPYCLKDAGLCRTVGEFRRTATTGVLCVVRHIKVAYLGCGLDCLGDIAVSLRDPRDMLISQYYSYGWTHPEMRGFGPKIASWHAERRALIRRTPLEEYVLLPEIVKELKDSFDLIFRLHDDCVQGNKACIFFSYADMVKDYPEWYEKVCAFLHCANSPSVHSVRDRMGENMNKVTGRTDEQVERMQDRIVNKKMSLAQGAHVRSPEGGQHEKFSQPTQDGLRETFARELEFINELRHNPFVTPAAAAAEVAATG